jgi:putative membrane protein
VRPRLAASLVLIGILFVFAVQNAKTVEIVFFVWRLEISRALLLFVVFVLGGTVGWFLKTSTVRHKRQK